MVFVAFRTPGGFGTLLLNLAATLPRRFLPQRLFSALVVRCAGCGTPLPARATFYAHTHALGSLLLPITPTHAHHISPPFYPYLLTHFGLFMPFTPTGTGSRDIRCLLPTWITRGHTLLGSFCLPPRSSLPGSDGRGSIPVLTCFFYEQVATPGYAASH